MLDRILLREVIMVSAATALFARRAFSISPSNQSPTARAIRLFSFLFVLVVLGQDCKGGGDGGRRGTPAGAAAAATAARAERAASDLLSSWSTDIADDAATTEETEDDEERAALDGGVEGEDERLEAGVARLLEEGEEEEEEAAADEASERAERRTEPDSIHSDQCSSEQKISPPWSTPVMRPVRQRAHL
jgi:hypothetical protein